jgi:hypothetical protein
MPGIGLAAFAGVNDRPGEFGGDNEIIRDFIAPAVNCVFRWDSIIGRIDLN